jgi:hypothetical protein
VNNSLQRWLGVRPPSDAAFCSREALVFTSPVGFAYTPLLRARRHPDVGPDVGLPAHWIDPER